EFQSVDGDGSNEVVPFQHRDGERRADWPLVSHSIGILGIALDVRDVYRPPLKGSTRRDAVASRSDRVGIYELPELRRHVRARGRAQKFTVEQEEERPLGLAYPDGVLNQCVEDGLKLERRAADDLEHVGGGGLLLQRFAQLVEQARVLNRDD